MNLRTLFIEDDHKFRQDMIEYFNDEEFGSHVIKAEGAESFEKGIEILKHEEFDIIILDLYKGDPSSSSEKLGLKVLEELRHSAFTPVIFYSGLTKDITDLKSEIVGIVNKGDGFEGLSGELDRIISSKLALIKAQVYGHVKESLREYFWDTVHSKNNVFIPDNEDFSLGYLLLRRLAKSLSKEKIKELLGDDRISFDKAHPMEFYIYPSGNDEYEAGEIIAKDGVHYVILTPSCDFVCRAGGNRKVGNVLLGVASPLTARPEFVKYNANKNSDNTKNLKKVIESSKSDRYFFLPGTPFINDMVIDFQDKKVINYDELGDFSRVAKLDDPFAQAMNSSFIRYYNRIGYPDIDADYILAKFN